MTLAPGIHFDVPAAVYHADPASEPSLSSSIIKMMLEGAAIHAWHAHPRLGATRTESDPTRVKEIGTAAHKLILERGIDITVIDADDYKGGDAKKARAQAYAAGKAPLLKSDLVTASALATSCLNKARSENWGATFLAAKPEVVVIARDPSGAMLRIMVDKLEIGERHAVIWDVKTGDQSAAPQGLGRRIENMSMEIQAALYIKVLTLVRPDLEGRITFRWLFCENDAPHLSVPCELDAQGLEIGRRKVAYAIALWNRCMTTGVWPGYPKGIVRAEYPNYAATRWLEREEAYAAAGIDGLANEPVVERAPRSLAGAC